MKFNYFIDNHWNIFLNHICQFHPLERSFLTDYAYELNWQLISKNRKLKWNQELLESFENRYLWHELARNESITWNTPLIKRFKKRLDWFYLGRNINLPISDQFINEHRKKILIIETNNFLTEELNQLYGKGLLPDTKPKIAPITALTESQLSNLQETIAKESKLMKNTFENLYTEYIIPHLRTTRIEEIFENKFDYSQRYFKISPITNDVHGLTPEFEIDGKNVFGEFREGRGFFEINGQIELINGSLQEGPPRLYEMPRYSDMSFYPILLISQNLKSVFENFKNTGHKFIPVKLTPKKIKTDLKFHILQFEYDSLLKKADFNELQFEKLTKNGWFDEFESELLSKGEIKNYESIRIIQEGLKSEGVQYSKLRPLEYKVDTDEDIFTIEHDVIVNEFVKTVIESALPNQVLFESVENLNIRIPQEKYDRKKNTSAFNETNIVNSNTEVSKEFAYYSDKAIRLESKEIPFTSSINEDEFQQKQIELNVILPESFKIRYRNNRIETEEYEFLAISDFYTENEYSDRIPETYKSIIVAENGCGDSLGLILQKDNDYMLKEELYEFNHETGEVEKY